MFRLLLPYGLMLIIIFGYIYLRHRKLGPVILKVDRVLFSRYNIDSLLLVIIIAVACYFLIVYELNNIPPPDETDLLGFLSLGPLAYVYFYGFLLLAVVAREIEKPTFRSKGIASSRGFWYWSEIESYQWSKEILTLNMRRGGKSRKEVWTVYAAAKKDVNRVLKEMVAKGAGKSRKKRK